MSPYSASVGNIESKQFKVSATLIVPLWCDCKSTWSINLGFRHKILGKGRGTRDQNANICWIIKKTRGFQKNIYFCFINHEELCLCRSQHTLENSYRDENTRPPYLPPEKLVCRSRTGHETTDWFQIGKGVRQGCILSPCLFNFYTKYIT